MYSSNSFVVFIVNLHFFFFFALKSSIMGGLISDEQQEVHTLQLHTIMMPLLMNMV